VVSLPATGCSSSFRLVWSGKDSACTALMAICVWSLHVLHT
jgi:hypothetical protein